MARKVVTLNHKGIAQLLRSHQMQRLIHDKAEEVARNVEAQGITVGDREGGSSEYPLPVEIDDAVTDRARSSVILAHPAGLAVQAKRGALSRAASAAGLELGGESPDDLIEYTTKAGVKRMATRAQVANWTRGR